MVKNCDTAYIYEIISFSLIVGSFSIYLDFSDIWFSGKYLQIWSLVSDHKML